MPKTFEFHSTPNPEPMAVVTLPDATVKFRMNGSAYVMDRDQAAELVAFLKEEVLDDA